MKATLHKSKLVELGYSEAEADELVDARVAGGTLEDDRQSAGLDTAKFEQLLKSIKDGLAKQPEAPAAPAAAPPAAPAEAGDVLSKSAFQTTVDQLARTQADSAKVNSDAIGALATMVGELVKTVAALAPQGTQAGAQGQRPAPTGVTGMRPAPDARREPMAKGVTYDTVLAAIETEQKTASNQRKIQLAKAAAFLSSHPADWVAANFNLTIGEA